MVPIFKACCVVVPTLIADKLDESKVLKSEVEATVLASVVEDTAVLVTVVEDAVALVTVVEDAAVLATVAVELAGRSQILYKYSVQLLVILLYSCDVTLSAMQWVSAIAGLVKLTPEKRHRVTFWARIHKIAYQNKNGQDPDYTTSEAV